MGKKAVAAALAAALFMPVTSEAPAYSDMPRTGGNAGLSPSHQNNDTTNRLHDYLKGKTTPLFFPMEESGRSYIGRLHHFNSDGYRFATVDISRFPGDYDKFAGLSKEERTRQFLELAPFQGFRQFGEGPLGTDENDAFLAMGKDGSYTTQEKGSGIKPETRKRFEEIAEKYIIRLAK